MQLAPRYLILPAYFVCTCQFLSCGGTDSDRDLENASKDNSIEKPGAGYIWEYDSLVVESPREKRVRQHVEKALLPLENIYCCILDLEKRESKKKLKVMLFNDRREMRLHFEKHFPDYKIVKPFYYPNTRTAYLEIRSDFPERFIKALAHEMTHYLNQKYELQSDCWIEEGLSELISTFELINGQVKRNKYTYINIQLSRFVEWYKVGQIASLPDVLVLDYDSFTQMSASDQNKYYSSFWGVVNYLYYIDCERFPAKLKRYNDIRRFGDSLICDPVNAFERAFETSISSFKTQMIKHYIDLATENNILTKEESIK